MSFLSRLFSKQTDPREDVRRLWHRIVEIAREEEWYAECGVADTLEGRFDMVSAVLAVAMIRMETDPDLAPLTGFLTEFFVDDMDGQLRQSGVGDLMVGKKIGTLMSTLGGRIGAYREALSDGDEAQGDALALAATRNIELADSAQITKLADRLTALKARFEATSNDDMLSAKVV